MTVLPSDSPSAGAEPGPIILTFEDKLQLFWRRNSVLIIAFCVLVLLGIIGVGVWEHLEAKKEQKIQDTYTAVATPEALKAFADAHAGHSLAGVAYLRLADDAFAAGKSSEALANYEKAAGVFKDGPFAARTKLGLAVSKVIGGKAPEGAAELKQLAEDANQFKGVRAEAGYHLASISAEKGETAEVQKYSDLLMQIDPASPWTQRVLALRASLPAAPVAAAPSNGTTPPSAGIQFTPAAK